MRTWMNLFFVILASSLTVAQANRAVVDIKSMEQQEDGSFRVTCLDDSVEIRSESEITSNQVCTHFNRDTSDWTLLSGGIFDGLTFCTFRTNTLEANGNILSVQFQWTGACSNSGAVTLTNCSGNFCTGAIGEAEYSLEFFGNNNRINLRRLGTNFSGTFTNGQWGGGSNGDGTVRLAELNGTPNILQVYYQGEWRSVCDDSFDDNDGRVACRQLGFMDVRTCETGINIPGDGNFWLDDLECNGTESSLAECAHGGWGNHNCGESEHVQLYCLD